MKTRIAYWLLMVGFIIALMAILGRADATEACRISYDRAVDKIATSYPEAMFQDLPADAAARFVAAYNAMEPRTNFAPDRVVMVAHSGSSMMAILLVKDGCLLVGEDMHVDDFLRLMSQRGA